MYSSHSQANKDCSLKRVSIESLWLFLFVFSFFYELPLIKLPFDRISPRLQDFVFLFGIILYGKSLFATEKSLIYKKWSRIVGWFLCCSILSCIILLGDAYRLFSLLAALKYVEGLFIIKIALSVKKDNGIILYAAFWGLILDSLYCVYQLNNPQYIEKDNGVLALAPLSGPLSSSYFEISQLIPLASVLVLALLVQSEKPRLLKIIMGAITILNCWPLLFTGSRTGLFLGAISLLSFVILNKSKLAVPIVVAAAAATMIVIDKEWEDSELYTISRAIDLEEEEKDSIDERIGVATGFDFKRYDNAIFIPFIGAGFDIAPVNGVARVDYGVHSMYLYPLEQAGIIGFVFFISFLLSSFKLLNRRRKDDVLSRAAFSYLVAMLVVGIGAHNFWREFSSGNINTFIVFVFCLAVQLYDREKAKSLTCE